MHSQFCKLGLEDIHVEKLKDNDDRDYREGEVELVAGDHVKLRCQEIGSLKCQVIDIVDVRQ